jgi:hypothetical protein
VLYIVLVLVLAALGLLVTALITASSLWAWVSIGLSGLAGLILIADWLRRRRRPQPAADTAAKHEAPVAAGESHADEGEEQTELLPAAGELASAPEPDRAPEPDVTPAETTVIADPGEEPTSPEDAGIVSELDDEVVVVDEYPRYHLTSGVWLAGRAIIPIGVGEARELGFTPCAVCAPDAALVAAHRQPKS